MELLSSSDSKILTRSLVCQGISLDRNRVLLTYNPSTDHCRAITTDSKLEAREAAELACLLAFEALDRLEGNSCDEWRRPQCRLFEGAKHPQCSCEIVNNYTATKLEAISFHDCAWKVHAEEIFINPTPAPSARFKQTYEKIYSDALLKASHRSAKRKRGLAERQTLRVSKIPRTADISTVSSSKQVGSSSKNKGLPNTLDTLYSAGPVVGPVTAPGATGAQYVCDVCGHAYALPHTLKDHQHSHKFDFRCKFCGKSFSNRGNHNLHLKRFHVKEARSVTKPAADRPFVCEVCGKSYRRATGLSDHKTVHTGDVLCKICNWSYSNRANYRLHMERRHPEIAEATGVSRRQLTMPQEHVCYICQALFDSRRKLEEHIAVHRGETTCDQCNRTFPRKSALGWHKKKSHPKID